MDGQDLRRYGFFSLLLWGLVCAVIFSVLYIRADQEYREAAALVEAKKAELARQEERERAITRQRQLLQRAVPSPTPRPLQRRVVR